MIVNPAAGGGRAAQALNAVEDALDAHGVEYRTELARSLDHARELARAAAAAGEAAVAFGGDGLVGAIAGTLKHTEGILGVLPGGRGNDFARVLGIPLEPRAACDVLASGVVRELDLGEAGASTFVGIASCGFDSEANKIANQTHLVRGKLVYAYGALRTLVSFKPATFEFKLDGGEPQTIVGYSLAAANSKAYGGGMFLAPAASMEDGLLEIVVIGHVPKLHFLRLLPTVFKGEHVRQANVHVLRAREIEIAADRPFMVYADGDPIAELPLVIRALPAAVRVIVPR